MNKTEILADIDAKCVRRYRLDVPGNQTDLNAQGITLYQAQVLEQYSGDAVSKTISFYVVDEGGPAEVAYYERQEALRPADSLKDTLQTWLEANLPAAYVRVRVDQVLEDKFYGFATAWKEAGPTPANGDPISEVRLVCWKDGGNPPEWRELS